jgi:hypothetical protein
MTLFWPTSFALAADGPGGTKTATLSVHVDKGAEVSAEPPKISFWANPDSVMPGQSSTMFWGVENATHTSIDHGIGDVPIASSGRRVFPSESTTYTLTATGPGGTKTAQVRVEVVGQTPASQKTPDPPASAGSIKPTQGPTQVTRRVVWNGIPVPNVRVELTQPGDPTVLASTVSAADGAFTTQAPAGKTGNLWVHLWPRSAHYFDVGYRVTNMAGQPMNVGDLAIAKKLKLLSPANGAAVATKTPTLRWAAFPSAARYDIRVFTDRQIVPFSQSTQDTQITVSATLQSGTKYIWDVLAYNASGQMIAYWSAWNFTVK